MSSGGPRGSDRAKLDPSSPSPQTDDAAERARAQLPAAELQHRIRNLLALLQSVVRRTAVGSDTVENYVMHLEGRLGAIARGQDMALVGPEEKGTDLAYLLAEELLAHGAREGQQVTLSGPPIQLHNRAAALLGLTMHELTVNAVKFGALGDATGHLTVEWQVKKVPLNRAGGLLCLQWKEKLARSPPPQLARHGFGMELIERMLPYELNAEAAVELLEDGLRCIITVPLTADIAAGEAGPPSASG